MGRVVRLAQIPDCDFHAKQGKSTPAVVDCKTVMGGWGYACEECRKRWSVGGRMPPGEHQFENPLALEEPEVDAPSAAERDAFLKKAAANPPMDLIEEMMMDGIQWQAPDGCVIEMDGQCEHGYPSWAGVLGIV